MLLLSITMVVVIDGVVSSNPSIHVFMSSSWLDDLSVDTSDDADDEHVDKEGDLESFTLRLTSSEFSINFGSSTSRSTAALDSVDLFGLQVRLLYCFRSRFEAVKCINNYLVLKFYWIYIDLLDRRNHIYR